VGLLIALLILFVSSPSLLPMREGLDNSTSVDMQVGANKASISAMQAQLSHFPPSLAAKLDELESNQTQMAETLQELASGGIDFGDPP